MNGSTPTINAYVVGQNIVLQCTGFGGFSPFEVFVNGSDFYKGQADVNGNCIAWLSFERASGEYAIWAIIHSTLYSNFVIVEVTPINPSPPAPPQ